MIAVDQLPAAVSWSVAPARSGGSGTWVISGAKRSITDGSPVSLRQHRDQHPGIGLTKVGPQFVGVQCGFVPSRGVGRRGGG